MNELTLELMNQTTVSCSGKEITIQCDNHDVKDALMAILTELQGKEENGAD